MFCAKLKDLQITGDCPFSLLAPGPAPREPAGEAAGGGPAAAPGRQGVCPRDPGETPPAGRQGVCPRDPGEKPPAGPPQRKSSRSRVYLHTLAESICKLIFPEVSARPFEIVLII